MVNLRSHCRNYFVLLALMLLLPTVAAFAANSTFPVVVTGPDGSAVKDAKVIMWDEKHYDFAKNRKDSITDINGEADVVFDYITQSADSTTNPTPNMGVLVLPPDGSTLAFATKKVRFYNVFNTDAFAATIEIQLEQGCQVKFTPRYENDPDDAVAPTYGAINGFVIRIPEVPEGVFTYTPSTIPNFDTTNFFYTVHWRPNQKMNGYFRSNNGEYNYSEPIYYPRFDFSIDATGAGEVVEVEKVHVASKKGAITVNLPAEVPDSAGRMLHYGWNLTRYYYGSGSGYSDSQTTYLPEGMYGFNFALNWPDSSGVSPAPALWPNVEIKADAPVTMNYDPNNGAALVVNLTLGENSIGNEAAVNNKVRVNVEKLTDVNGIMQYLGYVDTPVPITGATDGAASVKLGMKLSPGKYRVSCFDNNGDPGVVDNIDTTTPPSCYGYPEAFIEVAEGATSIDPLTMVMPLKPAFFATVQANISNGYQFAGTKPVRVGYMPEEGGSYGYELGWWSRLQVLDGNDAFTKHVFVPFVEDRDVVVMANLEDSTTAGRAPLFKVFPPFMFDMEAGTQSPEQNYLINDANYVAYSGVVQLNGQKFAGAANMNCMPFIPGTIFPASDIFDGLINANNQTLNNDTDTFEYAIEKNVAHLVEIEDAEGNDRLGGFVPYFNDALKIADATTGAVIDLDLGGSFHGQLQVDGNPQPAVVAISVYEQNNPWYPVRSGFTNADGSFMVSGLKTGQYSVRINIDGPNVNDRVDYDVQTMPIFRRDIFVDELSTVTDPIAFNLKTAEMGYASGKLIDEFGNPIEGVQIGFTPKLEMNSPDGYMQEWQMFDQNEAAFFCMTDNEGNIHRPTTQNPGLIPLPAGEYEVWATGLATPPVEFSYAIEPYHGTLIGSVKIYAGQQTVMPDVVIERRFSLEGTINENAQIAKWRSFDIFSETGEYITSGYTDDMGKFMVNQLKPGPMRFAFMFDEPGNSRFYLEAFNFDPANGASKDFNLDPANLKEVQIDTVRADDTPLKWAGGALEMAGADQQEMPMGFYLSNLFSDDFGKIKVKLPDLTTIPGLEGFVYQFNPYAHYYEVDGEQQNLYPPPPVVLDLASTEPHKVVWTDGATVDIVVENPTVIPSGRTIGILMPFENFFGPISNDPMTDPTGTTPYPGMTPDNFMSLDEFAKNPFAFISDDARLAIYDGAKFSFKSLQPGQSYAFVSYEMSRVLVEDDIHKIGNTKELQIQQPDGSYIYKKVMDGPNVVLFYRHFLGPVFADPQVPVVNTQFAPLADFTVDSLPVATTIDSAKDVRIGFSENRTMTSGMFTWPAVFIASESANAAFPVKLPASAAYQLKYSPKEGEPYMPKVEENVFLPSTGKVHVMTLKKVNKFNGAVTRNTEPVNGMMILVSEGADVFAPDFQPIQIPIQNGQYNFGLPAGYYYGYVVPATGAPMYVNVQMGDADLKKDYNLMLGVKVTGRVVEKISDTEFVPVPGAAVNVMRKRDAASQLADGSPFYPYPAKFYKSEVYCAPDGTFNFMVEPNVNYYLQGISPMGYRPGLPKQIVVAAVDVADVVIELKAGLSITGTLAGPAMIEARPSFQDALQGQIAEQEMISTPAFWPDDMGKYPFSVDGLDPNKPYDLTIIPSPLPDGTTLAIKKVTNVIPGSFLGHVEFSQGFKLYGQLVDAAGNPLKAAGVPVNLAMTLSMSNFAPPDGFELPDGFDPTQLPDGFVPPDGFDPTQPPPDYDPTQPPPDYDPTQPPPDYDPTQPPPDYDPTNPPPASVRIAPSLRMGVRASTVEPTDLPEMPNLNDFVQEGMWTMTDANGMFVFEGVPPFADAFLKTEQGFSLNNVDYGRGRTESFDSPFSVDVKEHQMNIVIPIGGKVIGQLIDEVGQPVKIGVVEVFSGNNWVEAKPDADGKFVLSGVAPAPDYMLNVREVPGRSQLFRAGISVEPGKITDVGSLQIMKAVRVKGLLKNIAKALQYFFFYGTTEDSGMSIIVFDGNKTVSDPQLLNRSFMQDIIGENMITWDPTDSESTDVPFELFSRSGKAHVGIVVHNQEDTGVQTLVTWGWQPGLSVPTQEQLNADNKEIFDMSANPLMSSSEFGFIAGTLKHGVNVDEEYFPTDAAIAFYPVKKIGDTTEYELLNTPFPTAVTNPVEGLWMVEGIPQGTYRIKVISRKYGTQFFKKVITIGAEPVFEELLIGQSVTPITGIISDTNGNVLANASVKMILEELSTSTDATGKFSFFVPTNKFVIPQLEIKKAGYATLRAIDVPADATLSKGFVATEAKELGTYQLAAAAGVAEVTVTDTDTSSPIIGAEVTMIVEKPTSIDGSDFTIFTPAEVQFADGNGKAKFSSVPVGQKIRFRAKYFYYVATTTEVITTGADQVAIGLKKAPPKVFYTGQVTPVEGSQTELQLKAQFDFNQVVERTKMGFNFNGTDQDKTGTKFTYPDILGDRLTNFAYADTFTKPTVENTPVNAIVSYDSSTIGTFDVMAGLKFRKEYAVDPMSTSGFAGRMTDSSGNQLPVGLSVPPGYLPPEVESFELKVEDKPTTPAALEGSTEPATFAGPTFEFTFNGGNFGAGTEKQNGLFDVTLAYEEGTKLEPRWQDKDGNWSKVGIIEDSLKWDSPSAGYVTFKVSHLTKFAVLANVAGSASGVRSDFNGDGTVDLNDLIYQISWMQAGNTANAQTVIDRAKEIFPTIKLPEGTLAVPSHTIDDLSGDGTVDLNDLIMLISWIQAGGTTDTTVINNRAKEIFANIVSAVSNLPGEKVNR